MNYDEINQILSAFDACPAFEIFTIAEKTRLARLAKIINYSKNREVFSFEHRGEECFFLVSEGEFQLRLRSKQTKQLRKGEIFGEIALFNQKSRTGILRAVTDGTLVAICGECVQQPSLLPSELRYKLMLTLAQKMAGYFHEGQAAIGSELIARGESETVEFKSTVKLKDDIAKSVCAFMNHRGGTVFVGVDDKGEILGIGNASTDQLDAYRRDIGTVLRRRIGALNMRHVYIDIERIAGKMILRIDCDAAAAPVFYTLRTKDHGEQQQFIVRHDTRNEVLGRLSEAVQYIQNRFEPQASAGF